MTEAKRILVGVDPRDLRQGSLSPPGAEAVKQAIALAQSMPGEVTFFSALDPPEKFKFEFELLYDEREMTDVEREANCRESLDQFVERAKTRGVPATRKTAVGAGWMELTREAIDGGYDLVVVGTRNRGALRRALFGSTAMELLHNCPAPVWVTRPNPHPTSAKVLVASDFSQVSDKALRLALEIGSSCGAEMHLIHVVEQPYAQLSDSGEPEAGGEQVRHELDRAAAKQRLQEQLARVSGGGGSAYLSVADDTSMPDEAIAKFIESHSIDLLVIGTSARRGLAGVFLGNTAERLLTTVHCSLLVVKPTDFVCPVPLESYREADAPLRRQ